MKEELDDYIDDLEDDSSLRGIVKTQDPDYDPNEGVDQIQKKKKTKSKVDPKTSKKRKSGELVEVFFLFFFFIRKVTYLANKTSSLSDKYGSSEP